MVKLKEIKNVYAQDGVNVSTGDFFSQMAKQVAKQTYKNSPYVDVRINSDYFRSPTTWIPKGLPEEFQFFICTDGIGTKVGLYQASRMYGNAATDLIAMLDTDCVRYGGLPLILSNTLSVSSVGSHLFDAPISERMKFTACKMLLKGLESAAKRSGLVLLGGETAEKGKYVGSDLPMATNLLFDWEGAVTGVMHPDKMITGENVKSGHIVIALKENGFRSNGISSVRKALAKKFGENDWWQNPEATEAIRQAAIPSVLYSRFLATLNGWFEPDFSPLVKVHAIAHISGGGIESKFGHDILFRKGLSAELDTLFSPPPIMRKCKEWRGMSDNECYSTWNGGQGILLVIDDDQATINKVIKTATQFGVSAKVAGRIAKWKNPRIVIKSQFTKNRKIEFVA